MIISNIDSVGFSNGYGAVLGAFTGDASGAPLEFASRITSHLVEQGMQMKGGGILNIGPGQITDDSEMAMCQLQALHKLDPKSSYKDAPQELLSWYRKWAQTKPFDIGTTTSSALAVEQNLDLDNHYARIKEVNSHSKSNGALMRITPLAIWSRNLEYEQVLELISADTRLTHSSDTCVHASIAYTLAIQSLTKKPKDVDRAMQLVMNYLTENENGEVLSWIVEDSKKNIDDISVNSSIGFVRWGFTLAFHFLQQYTPYEEAIRQTLFKGGDSDTNAAIVGGMLGALHGVDGIPEYMSNPVLSFNFNPDDGQGYYRPDFLSATHLSGLMNQLYNNSR